MKEFSLAEQNRAYLRDIAALLVMLVQVVPYLGLGMLASIFGYQLVHIIPPGAGIYIQVTFLVLLFAMVILDTEPGWNMVLFLAFGMAAGMMLYWLNVDLSQLKTWIFFWVLLLISLTGGYFLKRETGSAAGILFMSTFLYMVGWFLISVTALAGIVRTIWVVLGLVLFSLVAMMVISQWKTQDDEKNILSLSIQFYVVLFNLFWLSCLL